MKKAIENIFKYLIPILCFVFCATAAFAYETVIINFPDKGWHIVYTQYGKSENIIQYTPSGQTHDNFTETVICHSFKNKTAKTQYSPSFYLNRQIASIKSQFKNIKQYYIKSDKNDMIVYYCAADTNNVIQHCQILRSTKTHEGVMLLHYMNKDSNMFNTQKNEWAAILRKAKPYYTHYRTNYILEKEKYGEL